MKKLCMVVFNYYDIDSRVKRQAEFAASMGWKVDVIALKSRLCKNLLHQENVRVYEIPIAKQRRTFIRYLFQYTLFCIFSFFLLSFLYIKNRYSVVQVHNLPDFLVFSALLPKLFGCPVLLDMHEITPEFFQSKYRMKKDHILIKFITLIEKLCIAFADHVITVNESVRELVVGRGVSSYKITTVLDSVDEDLFNPKKEKDYKNDKFIILYHGTLTPLYGVDVVIRSLAKMSSEEREKIVLKIAGEGPEEDALRRLSRTLGLEENVIFLGSYPVEEIPEIIESCDIGICPTLQNALTEHSLSTKLLEYVYMEKPVIASKLTTYQKYFDENCLSYFTPGDEKELSNKIIALMSDYNLRKSLATSAKERYRQYSWNKVREVYRDVLLRLSDGKKSKS